MSFLGMDYFDNPTARISMVDELNDPFECNLSNSIKPIIEKYIDGHDRVNTKTSLSKEKLHDYAEKYINAALCGLGVISFSETHRNLLMWAHYANNHSGICIEFESDWSKSKERLTGTNSKDIHSLRRVQYDTQRVDFSKYTLNPFDINESLVELCTKQLTLKSDEWLYEKEHRYIMSFLEADYVKEKPNSVIPQKIAEEMNRRILECNLKKDSNGYITTDCDELEFFYTTMKCNSFMYLIKIPPEKIKSIYLGHRFKDSDKDMLIEKIKYDSHPLHHISVYKCSISDSRFELDIKQIY